MSPSSYQNVPLVTLFFLAAPTTALAAEKQSAESAAAALLKPPESCSSELKLKYVMKTAQGHYLSKYEMEPNEQCDRMLEKGDGLKEVGITSEPDPFIRRIYHVNGDISDAFFNLPRPGKTISATYITMRPFTTEKLQISLAKPGDFAEANVKKSEKRDEKKVGKDVSKPEKMSEKEKR